VGLIELGTHRIGFWMAERTAPAEVPSGLVPAVEGTPIPGGATLVLVGADGTGVPVWSVLLHAPGGASLLLPWEDRLFVALGEHALLMDERGTVLARRTFDDAPRSAWRCAGALLVLGGQSARLIDRNVSDLWAVPLQADGFHPLSLEGGRIRLAAMKAESWDEIVLDARTGAIVG
jgi:hypothetical protein